MSDSCVLSVSRTESEFVVRVSGRGTMLESPAFLSFARATIEESPAAALILDLEECDALDSTFLGSLLTVHHMYKSGAGFQVVASVEKSERLLSPMHLDNMLNLTDRCEYAVAHTITLEVSSLNRQEFAQHVVDAHRQLIEIDCPNAKVYRVAVEQLEEELEIVNQNET